VGTSAHKSDDQMHSLGLLICAVLSLDSTYGTTRTLEGLLLDRWPSGVCDGASSHNKVVVPKNMTRLVSCRREASWR
jgi:hypothetical protein